MDNVDSLTPEDTLLCRACLGHDDVVAKLLNDHTFDRDLISEAMVLASWKGKTDVIRTLLARGANINHRGYRGKTAVEFASQEGKRSTVEYLLSIGAQGEPLEAQSEVEARKRLLFAVKKNDIEGVRQAIESGLDPNLTDNCSRTPLMLAAERGYLPLVKLLVELGADVNHMAGDNIENSALDYACRLPVDEPSESDPQEWTDYRLARQNQERIVDWLQSQGALLGKEIAIQRGDLRILVPLHQRLAAEHVEVSPQRRRMDERIYVLLIEVLPLLCKQR